MGELPREMMDLVDFQMLFPKNRISIAAAKRVADKVNWDRISYCLFLIGAASKDELNSYWERSKDAQAAHELSCRKVYTQFRAQIREIADRRREAMSDIALTADGADELPDPDWDTIFQAADAKMHKLTHKLHAASAETFVRVFESFCADGPRALYSYLDGRAA